MSHQPCAHYASGTNMISSTVEMIQEGWVKSQEEGPQVSCFLPLRFEFLVCKMK